MISVGALIVDAVKDIAPCRARYYTGSEKRISSLGTRNQVFYEALIAKFQLNKIAARWPARAVAQFYFIDN